MDGLPFYSTATKTLYILDKSGNSSINLTGNIEGNTISNVTITSLTGSNANITNVTGSNGNFSNLTGTTFTSTNGNVTSLTGKILFTILKRKRIKQKASILFFLKKTIF
jgi:hypothetical protein